MLRRYLTSVPLQYWVVRTGTPVLYVPVGRRSKKARILLLLLVYRYVLVVSTTQTCFPVTGLACHTKRK